MKVSTLSSTLLLVFIALLSLTPTRYIGLLPIKTLDRVVLVTAVALIAIYVLRTHRWGKRLSISSHTVALMVPILGIFIAGVVSVFMTPDVFADQRSLLFSWIAQVGTLMLSVYLADKAATFGSPSRLLGRVIIILACASAVGVFLSLANTTPLDVINALGLPTVFDAVQRASLLGQQDTRSFGLLRAQGFFVHPLEYGAVLVLTYAAIRTRPDVIRRRSIRWTVYSSILLGGVLSGARSIWLGIVLAELLIRYFRSTRGTRRIAAIGVTIVAFSLIDLTLDSIIFYINHMRVSTNPYDQSVAARLSDYTVVFSTVSNHPFGVGVNNWGNYISGFTVFEVSYYSATARAVVLDNDFLRFLAETGVFGLLMYAMYVLRAFLPLPYASSPTYDRSLAYVLTGVCVWQSFVFDALAFRASAAICAVLITIALRLERVPEVKTAPVLPTTSVSRRSFQQPSRR